MTSPASMAVGSQVENTVAHRVDSKDLVSGVDTRQQAADVQMPDNPAPRGETGEQGA